MAGGIKINDRLRRLSTLAAAVVLAAAMISPLRAQRTADIPIFWDLKRKIDRPDLSRIRTIRFLTESDYPPFHFIGGDGQLTGFEVDLAREICDRLAATCSVQSVRWDGLFDALQRGQGDAVMAAVRISPEMRRRFLFSSAYFRSPARFVVQKVSPMAGPARGELSGQGVAVAGRSAHEAYLKAFFPDARRVPFESATHALQAMMRGEASAAFVDGTVAAFWLNGEDSRGCCRFLDGAFTDQQFFGEGAGIAVRPDSAHLRKAFDWALQAIAADGSYARLYLKYFPVGVY